MSSALIFTNRGKVLIPGKSCGKRGYASPAKANKARRELSGKFHFKGVYLCKRCGKYHLTTQEVINDERL